MILQIKRLKVALSMATQTSLIGLDEPCVSTSEEDGICLAVSICVKLLDTKAFIFCATHYHYLTRISESFLNATKLALNTQFDNFFFKCLVLN